MRTVISTVLNNLCISCGACKGICPRGCITYTRKRGMFIPLLDEQACISCGLCADVCPGLGHEYFPRSTAEETVTGNYLDCYNAWSRDPILRHVSASGGVVSTVVEALLKSGRYDAVFTPDTYDYREQLKTKRYTAAEFCIGWADSSTPKSRYLPVSHEEAVSYIKCHRDERLIIIGTSCAIRGIISVIEKLGLSREQYLLIGLFCDKVFNYNVIKYFSDKYSSDSPVCKLHFKNKESGGWPGDMKFYPAECEPFYVPLSERARAKAYFMPERCLYCVDKLNVCADISVGDNYTGQDESKLGSNSLIVRTERGAEAIELAKDLLELREIGVGAVQRAQAIDWRLDNMYFGDLKPGSEIIDLNRGVPREKRADMLAKAAKTNIQRLSAGAIYGEDPSVLEKQIAIDNRNPNPVTRFVRRAIGFIKRKIKG